MAIATEIGSLAWENERPMSLGLTGRFEKQRGWGLLLDPSRGPLMSMLPISASHSPSDRTGASRAGEAGETGEQLHQVGMPTAAGLFVQPAQMKLHRRFADTKRLGDLRRAANLDDG